MIRRLSSSLDTFKTVDFGKAFNVVLADRTKEATKKDTRNGLGKSTLIDIIHFCLGAGFTSHSRLVHPVLQKVSFTLELVLYGKDLSVTRRIDDPTFVTLIGDIPAFPLPPGASATSRRLTVAEWTSFLGQFWFGAPVDSTRKYVPSFRSAISYFIRTGKDAFSSPFRHFRLQATWDMQVNNAFLLGLSWEDASDLQVLRDRKKSLESLKAAAEDGFLGNIWGSRGQLETERIRLEEAVKRTGEDLKAFKVLSQYREVEARADLLTKEAELLSDENAVETRVLEMYRQSVREEHAARALDIEAVYKAATVELQDSVRKELAEVEAFHSTVVENRRQFLLQEVDRLTKSVAKRSEDIRRLHSEQSNALQLLSTHGALDQYSKLQQAHFGDRARLAEIANRLQLVKSVEEGKATLKVDAAMLEQRARSDYDAKLTDRRSAVELFDENSQALYKAPGRLIIDVGSAGFKFDVEIERKGSTGISNMEIFCYDLMLAERWSSKKKGTVVLIHDSNIFADVDDRQIALALELARKKSEIAGFQYICTFNSDKLPIEEFSSDFNIDEFTRLRLTDQSEDGGLLGVRLPSLNRQNLNEPEANIGLLS